MIKREKRSGLKTLIYLLLALLLLFVLGINLVVNLVLNRLVHDTLIKSVNNADNYLDFNLKVRAFPYPKISINQLKYQYQGKPVVFIRTAYLNIAFFDLFKKQLLIYKMDLEGASINLPNLPPLEVKQEKTPPNQATAENSILNIDLITLKNISLIYSASPRDLPIVIKAIQIKPLSSNKSSSPLNVDLVVSKDLLNQLIAQEPPLKCPLSRFVTDRIQQMSLELTIHPIEHQGKRSAKQLLIHINSSGISFKEGSLPTVWQTILHRCFDDRAR